WLAERDYMTIIRNKTAHLFAAAASLGALIAGADIDAVARMAQFGLDFGLAFQITDDTLDYEAQKNRWGKRVGADLAEGKQTLPLLRTLEVADEADRATLLHELGNGRDFQTVQAFVHKYKAIDYSLDIAQACCRSALEQLAGFSDENEPAMLLRQVADSVTVRQY